MPITKSTPLATIIDDFVHSDDPKFAGKSKDERIKMAKGAYFGMQRENIDESANELQSRVRKHNAYMKIFNKTPTRHQDLEHPDLMRDVPKGYRELPSGAYTRIGMQKENMNEWEEGQLAPKGHTIVAHGVKGMKNTPWKKTFKSGEHAADWADDNGAEVHAISDLQKGEMREDHDPVTGVEQHKTKEQGEIDAKNDIKNNWFDPTDYTRDELHSHLKGATGASKEYRDAYVAHAAKHGLKKSTNESVELIDAIVEGNTIKSAKLFNAALMSKITSLIEERRQDIASNMFSEAKELTFHKKIQNAAASADIRADNIGKDKEGNTVFRKGFYYRHGGTSAGHAENVSKMLHGAGIAHEVVSHGEVDKPFKGGASVKNQSHFWVKVKPKAVSEAIDEAKVLPGHPYHDKTYAELKYIIKDAGEAAKNMKGHNREAESKYLDQVNDATSILYARQKYGSNQK